MSARLVTISKFLAKYLRHEPAALGLTLEPGGWVEIDVLLQAAEAHGFRFTRDELNLVVETSDKQRYATDPTGMKVRANQGHSVEVDLQLESVQPPAQLYHGTATRFADSIRRTGLAKRARHHVHLSADVETALVVGRRHGSPLVFVVAAGTMAAAGVPFFRSANGVWLVDHVPPNYLSELAPESDQT